MSVNVVSPHFDWTQNRKPSVVRNMQNSSLLTNNDHIKLFAAPVGRHISSGIWSEVCKHGTEKYKWILLFVSVKLRLIFCIHSDIYMLFNSESQIKVHSTTDFRKFKNLWSGVLVRIWCNITIDPLKGTFIWILVGLKF